MEIKRKRFDELTIDELYEILRCRSEVFVGEQQIIYQDMDGLDKQSTHVFIEDEGKIRAYLRVIDPGVKFPAASIGRVLTMKDARGDGLARRLMEEGIRVGKSMSDKIEIEAQACLLRFYESLGFKAVSEEFILEGIPHISMKL